MEGTMSMGIGKSAVLLGKAGDAKSLRQPDFAKGIGAQAQSGLAQASFANRVWACVRHGALASLWAPEPSPKHSSLKLRHGILRLELPRGVDPTKRALYEDGIFRLFFGRVQFKPTDRPLGFDSARAPDSKWERRMIKEAIKFANQIMWYAEECGIDPSQFLEAAARFGEEADKDDSLAQFMKLCLENRNPSPFASMAMGATAAAHIGDVGKALDQAMFALHKRNKGYLLLFHKFCASKSLSCFAETMASNIKGARSMKQSPEVFKQHHFVRGKIAMDCLDHYHRVLAESGHPRAMLLAAEQSECLKHYREVLLYRKGTPSAIVKLLANLETAGKDADDMEAARLCIKALGHLLPIELDAARILAELGIQYEKSDDLKGLVPTIVQLLEAIQNP
jgi:hypothetical protein